MRTCRCGRGGCRESGLLCSLPRSSFVRRGAPLRIDGSGNFQQLVSDWRATQLKVEESLASINAALAQASQQYAQAEEGNARMFIG